MIRGERLPTIEARRVALRWLVREDEDDLFAIFSDPEVTRYWSWPAYTEPRAAHQLLLQIQAHFRKADLFQWGVARRDDDRIIGTCTLAAVDADNARAEIGFALARQHWGSGLMSEALEALLEFSFGELGLMRIEADVDPRNASSIRLLERLGFEREGLLRERWRVDGGVQDSLFYGLLERDWQARRGS